jgi:hypothetical protein
VYNRCIKFSSFGKVGVLSDIRGVARSRTPITVTEVRTQHLAFLSQHHWCSACKGAYHTFSRPNILLASAALPRPPPTSGNMLLCSVPHVQPRTGIASRMTGYFDWRIQSRPACGSMVIHVYHCILIWVLDMSVTGKVQKANKNEQKPRRQHCSSVSITRLRPD